MTTSVEVPFNIQMSLKRAVKCTCKLMLLNLNNVILRLIKMKLICKLIIAAIIDHTFLSVNLHFYI